MIKARLAEDLNKRKDFEMYYQFDITKENGEYVAHFLKRSLTLPEIALKTKGMLIAPAENNGYKAGEEVMLEVMCGYELLQ